MAYPNELLWIELARSVLKHNIRSLRKLAGKRLLSICVKANAYGHGLGQIVPLLAEPGQVEYLTVHSIEEAIFARDAGWSKSLMILGPITHDKLPAVLEYDLEPVIFDAKTLVALGKLADKGNAKMRTHLKLETGTNRQGITADELPAFARIYKASPQLGQPYGASMHFANIEDTTNHAYAEHQLCEFRRLLTQMAKLGIKPRLRHTASSAALILFDKTRFDLVRPGLSAYGHWPSKETYLSYRLAGGDNDLFKPVLSLKTRLTQLKKVAADSFVGYGCTYRTTAPAKLAIIPIGYADGFPRTASNQAHVLIRGRRAPVRGRVCMNLTMVDVTDIKGVRQGDVVTVIGRDGDESVTAEQLAQWSDSINYEILSRLSPLLPRQVV